MSESRAGDEMAFPSSVAIGPAGDIITSRGVGVTYGMDGLTKRELFAAMFMASQLAAAIVSKIEQEDVVLMRKAAIVQADALLTELQKDAAE